MRVLMLSDFYRPYTGGVEVHVENLGRSLVQRGHDVTVATLAAADQSSRETIDGVDVRRIGSLLGHGSRLHSDPDRLWAPPMPDPGLVRSLRRLITETQPDVIHGHDWMARSFLPLRRWARAAFVITHHYYTSACPKKSLLYRDAICSGPAVRKCVECTAGHYGSVKGPLIAAANWTFAGLERKSVDATIVVSRATASGNRIDDYEPSCFVIPNFLAPEPDSDGGAGRFIAELPETPFLLFVGDLRRAKGIDVLLSAYRQLVDPPRLVLIGSSGPETPSHMPAGVSVHAGWPNHAVRAAWRRCLFGVVPSLWAEPFGIVLLECMAAGRPVVASRTGGIPEVVEDRVTGDLVAPGDSQGLAAAISGLIGDPARRERMGAAAAQHASRFSSDSVVPTIESVYTYALGRARAAARR